MSSVRCAAAFNGFKATARGRWMRTATAGVTLSALVALSIAAPPSDAAATRPASSRAVKTVNIPYGTVLVASGSSIIEYAPGARGDATPTAVISGTDTTLAEPYDAAFDNHGNIWTADLGSGQVDEFAAGANGDAPPIRIIPSNPPTVNDPDSVALTPDGSHVWVGNDTAPGTLSEFATAGTSTTPTRTITGSKTGITRSHQLTVSADGRHLWEADAESNTVREFSTTGPTNQRPQRVLHVTATSVYVEGVAASITGPVWATNPNAHELLEYTHSNTTPHHRIAGIHTNMPGTPSYLSIDAAGKVWVAIEGVDTGPPMVEAFSPNAHGDASPIRTISGPSTGLTQPESVKVYGAAPAAARALRAHVRHHKTVHLAWDPPKHLNGGLMGYVVLRRTTKHKPYRPLGKTTKRRFSDRPPSHHRHHYSYAVIAYNQFGGARPTKPVKVRVHS